MSTGREDLPEIPERMLSLRNGIDHPDIWIACDGIVYDVTNSRLWKKGRHYEHWAGQALDDELPDAPHDREVFANLPVVGRLVQM
ncbi:MAG: cytochrome b5 [Candidatus Dadabacteria bacterium]|nr:MAG: cytochrome b5 [Candidatus Dadabacteria bacterium]